MTVVVGQIEPLKKLKDILREKGITRFNSIGDINAFINNYETEKKEIPKAIKDELDKEIDNLQASFIKQHKIYEYLKNESRNNLLKDIKELENSNSELKEKRQNNFFYRIIFYFKYRRLTKEISTLKNNLDKLVEEKTKDSEKKTIEIKDKLKNHTNNKENIIESRCSNATKELEHIKKTVDELYTLIAGAVGENSTVNELEKLSDNHYLINDFSLSFDPPIYNKKEDDKIFSIQIDHLLICRSGVFLLETKNWSKQSIQNLDLRSPIEQIKRTSYALFVLLNSNSNIHFIEHHWGDKKIPIRNVIVMTNEKPKEEFKYVKVLTLNELISYIKYFDEIFKEAEVESIFKSLTSELH